MKKYFYMFFIAVIAAGFFLIGSCTEDSALESASAVQPDSSKISFAEITEQENKILNSYELLDKDRGLYRIPILKAMELISKSSQE